ncbi:hypothetical protein DSCA_12880 [Desulfosarcina alkanivorans]|uniref:Uncharacterized protein n=1 Tax=Desulfosarcina alkanivorans TaxID=571177 RepID=A0A5K7YE62_9BACT|nr:hypothetical protein [Desulfosarcina alkanivorans]BBO67358.1 hypothetical protein DSCA_12880 [Desulfosarcina alkanivorans]
MKNNFLDDLIQAVTRVVTPNVPLLREVLVIGGMPKPTQNLRYLSYNRHTTMDGGRACDFSAVAVVNNRRARQWQLSGYPKKLSRWVFSTRWTRNPLDLYLNNIRCDPSVVAVLAGADSQYSLLGILTMTDLHGTGLANRREQYICPVVAVPGIDADALKTLQAFEAANQIKKSGIIGLQFYRKTGQMAGV